MSKFCTSCGAALEEGQQFCGSCGSPAQGSGTAGVPYSTADAQAAANSEQTKLFVFWLFLGWLGVHCFAAGKKKRGKMELILGLIATIVWIGRGIYAIAAASSYSYSDVEDMINTTWVLLAIAGVFFALFCTLWIPDLIGIVKGTFANEPDIVPKVPGFIKAGLPGWKFTKKHLVFIALLVVLEIVGFVIPYSPILSSVIYAPSLLCGIFFGPLWGTVIMVGLSLLTSLHGGYPILGNLLLPIILSFISGYIVYGIPKIRAWRDKQVFSSSIARGLLIGIAVFVGQQIGSVVSSAVLDWRWHQTINDLLLYSALPAALAGLIGVLLPTALAKKGLLLGPFVKEGEQTQTIIDMKQVKEKISLLFAKLPFKRMAEKIPTATRAKAPLLDKAIPFANQIACGLALVLVIAGIAVGSVIGGRVDPENLAEKCVGLIDEDVYTARWIVKALESEEGVSLDEIDKRNAQGKEKWEKMRVTIEKMSEKDKDIFIASLHQWPPDAEAYVLERIGSAAAVAEAKDDGKNIVIPAERDGKPVTVIDANAYADNTEITSVVIPEGITSIGRFAFANCTALKRVTLPKSIKDIGDGAFLHCGNLSTVEKLPAAVDGEGSPVLDRLGDFAFGGCEKLDSKTRAALAALGVTDFALGKSAFSAGVNGVSPAAHYDPNLRVDVPYAGLLGLNSNIVARNLFASSALTREGDTEARLLSAQVKGSTFSGVIGLFQGGQKQKELSLSVLTGADGANYLAWVQLQNMETGQKTEGRYDDIPDIDLYNMNESTGQEIGKALGLLLLPITEQGFYNNRRLATTLNPGILSPAALAGARRQITPEDEFTVGLTATNDGAVIKKYTGQREYVNIPEMIQGFPLREIGREAFANKSVVVLTVPDGVKTIGDSAFSGCKSLTELSLPDGIKTIGRRAFYDCARLDSVTIPDGVTTIGEEAFDSCTSLSSVSIPDSVTSMGLSVFYDCTSLASVTLPNSITSIPRATFTNCTSLSSVILPDSLKTIERSAFNACTSLASVTIPKNVTSIGYRAFYQCKSLSSVAVPNSVSSFGDGAFNGCASLYTVTISPAKRRYEYNNTFNNCPKLSLASQAALKAAGYTGGF